MLSIAKIKSSAQAMTYYEMDDYYTDPEAQGAWRGNGAAALGLKGDVHPDAFKSMLEGELPNGRMLGSDGKDGRKHVPGWDLTFSAPKSVSILVELEFDERLQAAHDKAVGEALQWVEEHAIGTRVRSKALGRLFVRTESMVAATFTHHTSRNQDPDTHTHVVVMNATETAPGEWRSLQSHAFFKQKMAIGAIYRAALAREAQALGYEIDVTHRDGRFDIVGVPEDLMKEFSSRTNEIDEIVKKRGRTDAVARHWATMLSRKRKENVPHDELLKKWHKTAKENNANLSALVKQAKREGPRAHAEGINLHTAVKDAIDLLSESESVFTHANVVRHALAGMMGRTDVAAVEVMVKTFEKDGRLRRVDEAGTEQWTTPRAQEQERRLLEAMRLGKNTRAAIVPTGEVERLLAGRDMNEEQLEAANLILTSPDQYIAIVGLPGVGKTTRVLNSVREIANARGRELVGMAQNRMAANNLEKEAGIKSYTVLEHVYRINRDVSALRTATAERKAKILSRYANQLWVVDEASQLSNSLSRKLINAAQKLGVQVVVTGDDKQIAAIEAGQPFAQWLKHDIRQFKLQNIQRTKNTDYIEAIKRAREGDIEEAFKKLAGDTLEIEDSDSRIAAMLESWKSLGDDERKETLLLTARNAERTQLNDGVRDVLLAEGKLTENTDRVRMVTVVSRGAERRDARFYEKGWLVTFNSDNTDLGIKKGEYWQVAQVDRKRSSILLQSTNGDGKTILWKPREYSTTGRRGFEIFKPEQTTIAVGDEVRWGRNYSSDGLRLANGQLMRVTRIEGNLTTFLTEGREITIDQGMLSGSHWDHAYASTVYSSQGRSIDRVLVNAESYRGELLSQHAFMVAISRHRQKITLFTDDRDKLQEALENEIGDKSSALDATERAKALLDAGVVGHISHSRRHEIKVDQMLPEDGAEKAESFSQVAAQGEIRATPARVANTGLGKANPAAPSRESKPIDRTAAERAKQISWQLTYEWTRKPWNYVAPAGPAPSSGPS
jgi:conjugative relaxase-like TrwC/TraI family protein